MRKPDIYLRTKDEISQQLTNIFLLSSLNMSIFLPVSIGDSLLLDMEAHYLNLLLIHPDPFGTFRRYIRLKVVQCNWLLVG